MSWKGNNRNFFLNHRKKQSNVDSSHSQNQTTLALIILRLFKNVHVHLTLKSTLSLQKNESNMIDNQSVSQLPLCYFDCLLLQSLQFSFYFHFSCFSLLLKTNNEMKEPSHTQGVRKVPGLILFKNNKDCCCICFIVCAQFIQSSIYRHYKLS